MDNSNEYKCRKVIEAIIRMAEEHSHSTWAIDGLSVEDLLTFKEVAGAFEQVEFATRLIESGSYQAVFQVGCGGSRTEDAF